MKYDFEQLRGILQRRGARFNSATKEVSITNPKAGVVGIDTLGKLEYFQKIGYKVILPEYKFFSIR